MRFYSEFCLNIWTYTKKKKKKKKHNTSILETCYTTHNLWWEINTHSLIMSTFILFQTETEDNLRGYCTSYPKISMFCAPLLSTSFLKINICKKPLGLLKLQWHFLVLWTIYYKMHTLFCKKGVDNFEIEHKIC